MIYDFNQEANGKTLKYSDGKWTEVDTPLNLLTPNSIRYGEDTWNEILERSGYETKAAKFGDADSFNYEVYHRKDERRPSNKPRYFVLLCLGGYYQHVIVEDYPNLLQLLSFLAPIASSATKKKSHTGGGMIKVPEKLAEQLGM